MPLTHFDIQSAKPRDKAYKLADGGGLYLLIQPSGSKLWRMKYRNHGTERLLSFGPTPISPSREHVQNATKQSDSSPRAPTRPFAKS